MAETSASYNPPFVPDAGNTRPAFIGIVDGGGPKDPVSGTSLFQHDDLIGLRPDNNISITLDSVNMDSFGVNKSIEFDSATGTLNIDPFVTGFVFQADSGLKIDLNQ